MSSQATRRTTVRWLPFAVVVVFNTAVSLSTSVTQWWAVESTPATTRLPAAADGVLEARSNSSNADVHTVLWFLAAVALVWAMRSHSRRSLAAAAAAAAALLAYTVVLEIAQRLVPTRTSQWLDVVGNGLGIAVGLAVGCASLTALGSFRRGRMSTPAGVQSQR